MHYPIKYAYRIQIFHQYLFRINTMQVLMKSN
nr:MAG TPA: hypothetical protein [Crassvirales sp.]